MKKLKKLLSDQAKDKRHRRHQLNLHITVVGWIVEFSAFFAVILGSFILGHGNVTVTLTLQTFTIFMMFNVLPCVYLINDVNLKVRLAESMHYYNFLRFFKIEKVNLVEADNDENGEKGQGNNDNGNRINQAPICNQDLEE